MVEWLLTKLFGVMKLEIGQKKKRGKKKKMKEVWTHLADLTYIVSKDCSLVEMVILDKEYRKQQKEIG